MSLDLLLHSDLSCFVYFSNLLAPVCIVPLYRQLALGYFGRFLHLISLIYLLAHHLPAATADQLKRREHRGKWISWALAVIRIVSEAVENRLIRKIASGLCWRVNGIRLDNKYRSRICDVKGVFVIREYDCTSCALLVIEPDNQNIVIFVIKQTPNPVVAGWNWLLEISQDYLR